MRIKRYRGNATVLALFILLASSLIWVLVALYMKNFLSYSDEIVSYERTSYLAKAGTELGLAIVWSREPGVEYALTGGTIMKNFTCPYPMLVDKGGNEYCPKESRFSLKINWLADSYNHCDNENMVEVKKGLSLVIPLFRDPQIESVTKMLTHDTNVNGRQRTEEEIWKLIASWSGSKEWNLGEVYIEENNEGTKTNTELKIKQWKKVITSNIEIYTGSNGSHKYMYLIVANPDYNNSQSICITGGLIPQETTKIVSIWYYNWRQLGTETFTTKSLPDFLQWDVYLTNSSY